VERGNKKARLKSESQQEQAKGTNIQCDQQPSQVEGRGLFIATTSDLPIGSNYSLSWEISKMDFQKLLNDTAEHYCWSTISGFFSPKSTSRNF
jgi:hypothetical protein